MRNGVVRGFVAVVLIACPTASMAQSTTPTEITGRVQQLWMEPSQIMAVINQTGPCGNNAYVMSSSAGNFQNMTAALMTAGSSGKSVTIQVYACSAGNNVISHGAINF